MSSSIKKNIDDSINFFPLLKYIILIHLYLLSLSCVHAMDINTSELFKPKGAVYDITNTAPNTIQTMKMVEKILVEVDAISGLMPREFKLGTCSETGCPVDSIQCDAVTETPYCPDGSILNTTRDMCQKDPDVFNCPTGYTYDKQVQKCVRPLECPNDGIYVVERQRCEYKRIYECPMGYTQDGDTCIAPPVCPNGAVFDATLLKCTAEPVFACADA
ncbi:MAG: hypothetical protein EOM05_11695, partial [Clostridia bacterium]|nr:hypothetical protein [Clostridia bacterium]